MTSLDKFKNVQGKITMLALDHRGSFKKTVESFLGREATNVELIELKKKILKALVPYATGVLVDKDYGLPAYEELGLNIPFLLPLEKSGYTEDQGERLTELGFTVSDLKNQKAEGAKLLVYTNPNLDSWNKQLSIMHEAMLDTKNNNFPFFLEFVLYDKDGISAGTVAENVEKAVQENIIPDVWKVAYPGSIEESKKLTSITGNTPWILLTGGGDFETFYQRYKESVEGGAKGFLAGRALWGEACEYINDEERLNEFLTKTLPERFERLLAI